ncbi:MAG: efflux RND transporter permease subunit [Acidobacteriota bacterium]
MNSDNDPFKNPSGDGRKGGLGRLSRLSDFSIRFPVTICMVLLSFLVLGGVSMTKIPLVLFPNINEPLIAVFAPYPNATPEQVQQTITKPLEEVLSTIPHVSRISSTASANEGSVILFFDWGEDIDYLRSEVRTKVEQIRKDLPEDLEHVFVRNWNTSDIPIIEGRIASGRDLRGSYDFLDAKIKKPLERVAGVAEVEIGGVERKELEINLRLDDLKRYHVDVGSLFQRLDSVNLNTSLGRVDDGGYRFGVITDSAVTSLDQLRGFPVDGRGLQLRDIADIELRDPALNYGRHLNGDYAISLEIKKASDANTVKTVERVMEQIERLNNDPSLQGIQVLVWHNSGKEITKSLFGLLNAGMIGALLAIFVLYLFLRKFGATLAIGFAIPFSIVAAIGFLYLMGNTLNVLSMMGLMLSTGMLVDNAVVVLESIYRHLERGTDRVTAARVGTHEVLMAVVASTLTSVIIFVPLVFGKKTNLSIFLGHTGTAIIITLFCSLFVSMTLIPLGVARFIEIDVNRKSKWQQKMFEWLRPFLSRLFGSRRSAGATSSKGGFFRTSPLEGYLRVMSWTLNHRGLVLVTSAIVVAVSFQVLSQLPDTSPEAQELRDLSIDYDFSESYHYAKIETDFINPVESYLFVNRERFKIKDVYSWYANNEGQTRIYFDTERLDLGELTTIRKEISKDLPVIAGAEIRLGRQEGAQNENWIGVNIYGDDSVVLQRFAAEARKKLLNKESFNEVHTALDRGRGEVQITLNRELAKRVGVSPQSVAQVLDIVMRGRRIRGYRTSEGEVEIWVKLQSRDREDLSDLKSMVVGGGPEGQDILLTQVADLNIVKTPEAIQREDRQTYTGLWANYGGEKKDEGKESVTEVMNSLKFPSGYGWSYGFWTQREDQENQEFIFNLLLALFMVYFVMASLFESLAHPFAIMISLVFAFVGVAWFLFLTGTPFNLMAMIGLMILMGIVVNNGIVLLDHINHLRQRGMPRATAILEGCRDRFRPILMTATTTVVGLLPLAVGTTSIFELRYFPMARTVMGGLIASTILTLVVLPTVYTVVDDLSVGLKRIWFRSKRKADPGTEAQQSLVPTADKA